MVSRRDQFQAYRFVARRNAAALLGDDSDSVEGPLRRMRAAAAGSVMLALLAVAAVAVFALVKPGGAGSWRDGKALIVEQDTGARYVYLNQVLHPVLNVASARLILHSSAVVTVSAGSLAGTPRGVPVGIPGAPDSVPGPDALVDAPWTVCSEPAVDGSGAAHPIVRATVGQPVAGTALPPGSAVLATTAAGDLYLVWNGRKLRIASGDAAEVRAALNLTAVRPLTVGYALLNTLAAGVLQAPSIGELGAASRVRVSGSPTRIGQVFTEPDSGTRYAVTATGLAPLTAVQVQLLITSQAYTKVFGVAAAATPAVTKAEVAGNPAPAPPADNLPQTVPAALDVTSVPTALCASTSDTNVGMSVLTAPMPARTLTGTSTTAVDALGGATADEVSITPAHGALVREQPNSDSTAGVYLITDAGVKYQISTAGSVLDDLGLKGVSPAPIPKELLFLFRTGPTLDEAAAAMTAPEAPSSPRPASS